MSFSHLDMFYETRFSLAVNETNPANNPNSNLNHVPTAAEIRFADGENRFIDGDQYEAPNGKGFEMARFLISRALLDPDAIVVPA